MAKLIKDTEAWRKAVDVKVDCWENDWGPYLREVAERCELTLEQAMLFELILARAKTCTLIEQDIKERKPFLDRMRRDMEEEEKWREHGST